jgi:hypothetical protein
MNEERTIATHSPATSHQTSHDRRSGGEQVPHRVEETGQ